MLTASSITLQFAAKPLFENVSVKFGDGNRYGLIGANGCGKSTFMKILAGELEPSAGNVSLDPGERMAWLRQDQFGYEDIRVLELYEGAQVGEGKKSLALRMSFRAPDRTLNEDEVNKLRVQMVGKIRVELGAELRG